MTQSNRVLRTLVRGALFLSLVASGMAGAAQPGPGDPLQIIPADALFCVRVNKLMTTLGQMDQFLTGISPMGLSMPVRAQLGQFLGQPEPAGLNMTGDVVAFWPLPGGEKPDPQRVGILIPLSSFDQFLTNGNVTKPNAQGLVQIGPEGKPVLAGTAIGNYLLLTRVTHQQALTEAKNWTGASGSASLAQRLSPEERKRATDAPAWAYANIQIANKMFGPALQQKIKQIQDTVQKMQPPGQSMPFQPQGVMEMYASVLNSLLQETQFVSISLDPGPTALRLASLVAALPNTDMAKTLSSDSSPAQSPGLLNYLDNGAVMNGVLNLSPALLKTVMLKYADLLTLMFAGAPKEDVTKFRQLMLDSVEALGGSLAWSLVASPKSKPPFEVKYVATLKDKQKFYQVLEQSGKMMQEGTFADFYKKLGLQMRLDVKRNVETYQGVPIDALYFALQPTDANRPDAQMMKQVFGQGFELRLATVNNLLLYTLSANPQQQIHALIDQAKAGGPTQTAGEVQAALNLVPEGKKAEIFGTYNILRLMQLGMAFAPMPMPALDMSSQSGGIVFSSDLGDGKLLTNVAIPKQHAQELVGAIMRMQQQKMQEQMKPQEKPPQSQKSPSSRKQAPRSKQL